VASEAAGRPPKLCEIAFTPEVGAKMTGNQRRRLLYKDDRKDYKPCGRDRRYS
jgi:hypothetical protein